MYTVSWVRLQESPDRLGIAHFGCDTIIDAAATGYNYNWVRLQLGAGCYGVRDASGCGYNWVRVVNKGCYNWVRVVNKGCYNWVRVVNKGCYNWVRLKLCAHIQLCVRAEAGWGYNWVRLCIINNLIILFQA
jgi:hypothetical protein